MYLDEERSTYQKVILCIFAAMAVIFAVWTAVSRSNEGVLFYETLLAVSEEDGQTVYSGELYGEAVTITCREENGTKLVDFSAPGHYSAACRVEYPEGTITTEFSKTIPRIRILRNDEVLFSGGYDPDPENWYMDYYNEDGTLTLSVVTSIRTSDGTDPWFNFEFDTSDIIRFANGPGISARGSWGIYFLTLFVTIICALLTAFPNTVFHLQHFLSVRDPEPTEFYYFMHKVGSVIFVVMLLITYIKGVTTFVS